MSFGNEINGSLPHLRLLLGGRVGVGDVEKCWATSPPFFML
jgi:hypothetical protein